MILGTCPLSFEKEVLDVYFSRTEDASFSHPPERLELPNLLVGNKGNITTEETSLSSCLEVLFLLGGNCSARSFLEIGNFSFYNFTTTSKTGS